jgi:ribosome-binding protein aMBF1 (putative translation factor)
LHLPRRARARRANQREFKWPERFQTANHAKYAKAKLNWIGDLKSVDVSASIRPIYGVPNIKVTFGDRIRKLRQAKGISQEDLADKAGLDRTYISSIERGKRNISLENIERLAKALKSSVRDLFKE